MPRHVNFYECLDCGEQFDSWSGAESCEWDHAYEKEQEE